MSKIEKYLGIANHDIQLANNNDELKSYIASILCEIENLQQENGNLKKQYCERTDCSGRIGNSKKVEELQNENQQLKIQISAREETCYRLESNWNKLKEWVNKHYDYYMNNEDYIGGRLCFTDIKNKIQELERGVSDE